MIEEAQSDNKPLRRDLYFTINAALVAALCVTAALSLLIGASHITVASAVPLVASMLDVPVAFCTPTVMALGARAGDELHALAVLFPAATAYVTPDAIEF